MTYRLKIPARRGYPRAITEARSLTLIPAGVKGPISAVSVNPKGMPGNGASWNPQLSPDGSKVAFTSLATDLTADSGADSHPDVFVRDLRTGRTTLVSRSADGSPAGGASGSPQWLPDSNRVLFASTAGNLGAPAGLGDLWVKDLTTGAVRKAGATGLAWNPQMPTRVDPRLGDTFPSTVPLTLSPDGSTVLAQVDPAQDPTFTCVPNPGDEWIVGRCDSTALGAITVADGTTRVLAGGIIDESASGPSRTSAHALNWSPDSRQFAMSEYATCYHCEGPNVSVVDLTTLTTMWTKGCGYVATCDSVRVSGWRSGDSIALATYLQSQQDPLERLSLFDEKGQATPVSVRSPWLIFGMELAGFSPARADLAMRLTVPTSPGTASSSQVASLRLRRGTVSTWSTAANGGALARGGTDPQWVDDNSLLFVTADPDAVRGDSNRGTDIVLKTRRR